VQDEVIGRAGSQGHRAVEEGCDIPSLLADPGVVEVRADASALPGTLLRSRVIPYQMIDTAGRFVRVDFEEPVKVSPGLSYHLIVHTLGSQGTSNACQWRLTDAYSSRYTDGEEEISSNTGTLCLHS
jgi:hypothetical protein